MIDAGPDRGEVLREMATRGLLPRHVELDYYTAETDEYRQLARLIKARGWLQWVGVRRETMGSNGDPVETFTLAGMTFTSPRNVTPLTDPVAPIEKLAAGAAGVVIEIDGVRVAIHDPRAADAIRDAVEAVVEGAIRDDAGRPLPSIPVSRDENVVELPLRGRGRQVASDREGA